MIHVKPKRNSVITVQFNTKSMGSETGNVEVLKILRAPNHDIVDNEEVWFEVNERYSVDHAYVNFSVSSYAVQEVDLIASRQFMVLCNFRY